jgi:hypothetical protein
MTVSYYEPGILHVYIFPDTVVELEDLQKVIEYVSALGPKKFLNLFEFDRYSATDDKVRKWASDPEGNSRTIADAIVIKGLDQKILADAYVKTNRPVKPTQLFNDIDEAVKWLLTMSE